MTPQHPDPITPPPELIKDWHDEWDESDQIVHSAYTHIAIRAAQWGADQELEGPTDEELLETAAQAVGYEHVPTDETCLALARAVLARWGRAARRPNPPSLKELALQALNDAVKMADDAPPEGICSDQADIIRRALEQLP